MPTGNSPSKFKQISSTFTSLIFIRLQMLGLEANEQKQQLIKIIVSSILLSAVFFLSFITLLFALNVALTEQTKIFVFFGLLAILVIGLIFGIYSLISCINSVSTPFRETIREIKKDVALLQEIASENEDTE